MTDEEFNVKLVALIEEAGQSTGVSAQGVVNNLLSAVCDLAVLEDEPLINLVYLLGRHYAAAVAAYAKRKMQ